MRLRLSFPWFVVLSFVLFAFCNKVIANDYYQRHYIILVDQTRTPHNQVPDGFPEIGRAISFLLSNDSLAAHKVNLDVTESSWPAFFEFNPQTDEISIFGFGIDSEDGGTFWNIRESITNNRIKTNEVLDYISNKLIRPYATFQSSGKSLSDFMNTDLKEAFSNNFVLDNRGVNLARYVYPCVLKLIETNPSSIDYYIIIVSNFETGLTSHGSQYDDKNLVDITVNDKYLKAFSDELKNLKSLFYTTDFLTLQKTKTDQGLSDLTHAIVAVGYKLGIKSLLGTSVYITSNLFLHETGVGATTYDLESVNISFNKDNHLKVDSLVMKVFLGQECLFSSNVLQQSNYDESETRSYILQPMKIDLGHVFHVGDKLTFQYLFFVFAEDEDGNVVLPMVFSAERNYDVTTDTIVFPDEQQKTMIINIAIILLVLICLALLAFYVWKKRGATRTASVDFTIWPISHDHFMDVKDKKVYSYDCWYWRDGDSDMNIPVSGNLNLQQKDFAKMFKYKLEAQIQDIDDNMDFSFRPDPSIKESNGNDRTVNEWYEVPIHSDGSFSFSANTYIRPGIHPNFSRDNVLQMKVTLRCVMEGDGEDKYVAQRAHTYKFTVRPEIENRNIWVAFDPGTTGSCVAYGASSNPTDSDDIYLAENEFDTLNDGSGKSHIYPSMIRLNHKSTRLFRDSMDPTTLSEGSEEDFLFGNEASIMWDEEGINCFQSIKKLLGYTDTYKIVNQDGIEREMFGQDIAHLLVKGLYNHIQDYVENDNSVNETIREMFVQNGVFTPQRAIVAVPNNYTMVKIQEMVDTVKRTNKFKEVHYIYEAEAVMMMYFRQCWRKLPELQNKIFVVYDMGGATINATAFKIKVIMGQKNGNSFIRRIEVDTISKVGYGVGGDDIDFALIQIMYNIPSIKKHIERYSIDLKKHQLINKVALIELVRELKLEIIAKDHHEDAGVSHIVNVETLYGHILDAFAKMGIKLSSLTEEDSTYLEKIINIEYLENNDIIKQYIYDNVEDAVKNLLSSIEEDGNDVELVMSGRSILFPGIQQLVVDTIEENDFKCHRWEGFDNSKGFYSAEKVKVAVATGACWYAMYSDYIKLHNNKVTSSFGYIDMIENEQKYVPVIERNAEFNEECFIEQYADTRSNLADVKFVQMLGAESDYDEVLKKDIKHKYNILDEVRPAEIRTFAETIFVYIDYRGNFSYKIKIQGRGSNEEDLFKVEDNCHSRLTRSSVKTEIVNENSPSYIFSTLNLIQGDRSAIARFKERITIKSQNDNKKRGGRF